MATKHFVVKFKFEYRTHGDEKLPTSQDVIVMLRDAMSSFMMLRGPTPEAYVEKNYSNLYKKGSEYYLKKVHEVAWRLGLANIMSSALGHYDSFKVEVDSKEE